jgi:hypothetical protein
MRGVFLVLVCLTFSARAAESILGSVKTAHGGVVVRRGGATIPVSEGMHLLLNDVLQTSTDGSLGAILQDGTRIALGPNTELTIDHFIYEPVDGKFGLVLRLARGVLAYVSGRIAKFAPGSVSVETPVGAIGLRGTHFAVTIEGT